MRSLTGVERNRRWLPLALAAGIGVIALSSVAHRRGGERTNPKITEAKAALQRLPLVFETNRGQAPGAVKFLSRGSGYTFFITPTESVVALARLPETAKHRSAKQQVPKNAPTSMISMKVVGGNAKAKVVHEGNPAGYSNYFIGNDPKKWQSDIPAFSRIRCEEVYPGVDLVYYGNQQELEHDFVLDPGTRPEKIHLQYKGVKKVEVDPQGELLLHTGAGFVQQKRPIAYQWSNGQRVPVEAEYRLLADNSVGFEVGPYDASSKLVIDPVLRYSTYIGGSTDEYVFDLKLDDDRNVYITGYTGSFSQDANGEPNRTAASQLFPFPTQGGIQGDPDSGSGFIDTNNTTNPNNFPADWTRFNSSRYDGFVTKVNNNGNGLVYSTYLGTGADDYAQSIAIDSSRNMYVTGMTRGGGWPMIIPVQTYQGGQDAFAVKLTAAGNQLLYSTYIGGSGDDIGRSISVDGTGNAHIAGLTTSTNLPVFSPNGNIFQPTHGGGTNDIFIVSLDASGSAFNYLTYFGGAGAEGGLPVSAPISLNYQVVNSPFINAGVANPNSLPLGNDNTVAIVVDPQGNAYLAGGTTSDDFYISPNALQPARGGGTDGFVAKFNPDGIPLYSTLLGGAGDDACRAIAINPQGEAHVTGYTASGDFPTQAPQTAPAPAFQATFGGGSTDAFVTRINAAGGDFIYSTFLGGSAEDIGNGIAVSIGGQAYVAGMTQSPFPTFPLVNPTQSANAGSGDIFVTKFRPDGSEYEYSTYLGGNAMDRGMAIGVNAFGQAYVTGNTSSLNLPTTAGAFQGSQNLPNTPGGRSTADTYNPVPNNYPVAELFLIQPHSPPFAPSNLISTGIGRNGSNQDFVSLAWTDNSDNENGFEVERKLGAASSTNPFSVVATVGTDVVTHTDVPLVPTTTYTYRVRPFNQTTVLGNLTTFYGPYSNQLTVTTLPSLPAAPSALTVTPIDTQRLKLDWTDNSNNEASFKIERRRVTPPSTSFAEIADILSDSATSIGTGARTFTDNNGGSGLVPNTVYEYRIRSSNVAGDSAYVGPVQGRTLPTAPSIAPILIVETQTNSSLTLAWTYDNNDHIGFKIYRAPETSPGSNQPGPYNLIRTDTQTTSRTQPPFSDVYRFTDPGLLPNTTFFYQVRAYNQSGDGPLSNEVSGTTLPDPPAAATNLDVTLVPGTTADIRLDWTDNSTSPAEESGFKIERSPDGVGSWSQVVTVPGNVGTGPVGVTLPALARNTIHYFRVIAFTANPSGDSDALPSNVDCALTLPEDASGLTATPVSQTQINLAWTDNNPTGTLSNFRIERSPDGVSGWVNAGTDGVTTAGGAKSFPVTGLTQNTLYFFRVHAFNTAPAGCDGGGDSPLPSNVAQANTLPGAVVTVTVTNIPPTTNLLVSFTDANEPASQSDHLVERSENGTSGWVTVADLPAGTNSVIDDNNGNDLDGNFTFYYRVTAHNSSGSAAPSPVANRLTLPAQPTNLTVTVPMDILNGEKRGRKQLDLTWVDNSRNPTVFRVERSPNGTTGWAFVANTVVGAESFTDTGLTENTPYCYRVVGVNANGDGEFSDPALVCATTLKVPPTGPTGLTATVISTSQINLAWTDTSNNEESYRIDRKIGANGAYTTLVSNLPPDTQTYQDTGLQPDTTYTYIVYAVNNGGESLPSREAGGTTLSVAPADPSNLVVMALSSTSINVKWNDNSSNETGFELERTPAGGSPTIIQIAANSAANPVSFNDTGLNPNTTYSYRVRAKNNNFSGWTTPLQSALTHPANPSNLSATAQSPTQILLQWTDNNGANPSGNRILRKIGNGSFVILTDRSAANGTTYLDDTVAPGTTYTYVVFALNSEGVLSAQGTNEATATTPATPPAAPINLVAVATSSSSIRLTWTDKADNETLFKIERATDPSMFRQVATRTGLAGVDGEVTFVDQGLVSGTLYFYRVRAANGGGDSGYSNEASTSTLPIPPGAPSALTATPLSTTSIRLDWTDGSSNETVFRIQRKNLTSGLFEDRDTVTANVTTYTDMGLTADTLYEYRVYAHNDGGDSGFSNVASARTHPNPPTAPSNLVATAQSQTSIRLTWQDNSTNETSFRLSRSTDDVNFNQIIVLGPNVTTYTDQGLTVNTRYYYRLVATNLGGDSTPATANTTTHPNPPSAPTNLQAQPISQTAIRLTWVDNASTETGFRVERRTASSQFAPVGTAGQNAVTFDDTNGLVANTTYTYRVAAINDGGSSSYTNDATATTLPNPPAAPTNLTVSVPSGSGLSASAVGSTQLTLNWVDQSDNETGFKIERRTTGTSFAQVGQVGVNVTTFTDQNLSPQTLYFYQVKATNTGGDSSASNEASNTTLPNPPGVAPNNLTAVALSSTQIRLNWTEAISDETGFKIERRTTNTSFAAVGSASQNATEFVDGNLTPNTTYFYQVRATNSGGESGPSNTANATTRPNPPAQVTGLTVSPLAAPDGITALTLSWTDTATETSYRIERRGNDNQFVTLDTTGQNENSYVDGGLSAATTYTYRVIAINSGGEGAPSDAVSGTTLPNPPAAPSDLVVIGVDGSTLRLQWRDNSNNEDGFKIDRMIDGNFVEVAATGANVTAHKIGSLPAGVVQTFRVRAFNAGGESVSGSASGVTPSSGRLRVSRPALSFGTVAQGNSATRSVRLTNIGTGPLQVGYVVPNAPYSVDAPQAISLMLQPRQSVDVVVRFTPTARGRATGSLQITSSDGRKPRATVRLTGVGGRPIK